MFPHLEFKTVWLVLGLLNNLFIQMNRILFRASNLVNYNFITRPLLLKTILEMMEIKLQQIPLNTLTVGTSSPF